MTWGFSGGEMKVVTLHFLFFFFGWGTLFWDWITLHVSVSDCRNFLRLKKARIDLLQSRIPLL